MPQARTILSDLEPVSADRDGFQKPHRLTREQRRALARAAYVDVGPLMQRIAIDHEGFNAVGVLIERRQLTEYEVVQRALHLADPNATILQKSEALLNFADGRLMSHGWSGPATTAPEIAERGPRAIEHWWETISTEREMFRSAVADILAAGEKRTAVRKKYTAWIAEALQDVIVVPRLVWDGTRSETELRYYSLNTRAACGYALMLLIDERRVLKDLLRRCKPESGGCGRPFLAAVKSGGSPLSVYCSDDCRANAKREQTAARVARLRARRAKGEAA
jgi:hypothetical protein